MLAAAEMKNRVGLGVKEGVRVGVGVAVGMR